VISASVGGAKNRVRQGKEIVCFSNIEWKKGMGSGDCKIWRTPHTATHCDMVSPEY
jgi:hypothetical protein